MIFTDIHSILEVCSWENQTEPDVNNNTTKYAPYFRWSHGEKEIFSVQMSICAFILTILEHAWSSGFHFLMAFLVVEIPKQVGLIEYA